MVMSEKVEEIWLKPKEDSILDLAGRPALTLYPAAAVVPLGRPRGFLE
jgi:hypothetical protein